MGVNELGNVVVAAVLLLLLVMVTVNCTHLNVKDDCHQSRETICYLL